MGDEKLDSKGVLVTPPVMVKPFLFVGHVGVVDYSVVLLAGHKETKIGKVAEDLG